MISRLKWSENYRYYWRISFEEPLLWEAHYWAWHKYYCGIKWKAYAHSIYRELTLALKYSRPFQYSQIITGGVNDSQGYWRASINTHPHSIRHRAQTRMLKNNEKPPGSLDEDQWLAAYNMSDSIQWEYYENSANSICQWKIIKTFRL